MSARFPTTIPTTIPTKAERVAFLLQQMAKCQMEAARSLIEAAHVLQACAKVDHQRPPRRRRAA